MNTILDYKPAGFFRRIAALFYDLILIIALCIGSILLITFFINTEILSPFMYLFFLVLSISFYCYFWKQNKGQTLFQDMCDRIHGGAYGRQSELALIACNYNFGNYYLRKWHPTLGTKAIRNPPTKVRYRPQVMP